MRAVIQRVLNASVQSENQICGSIDKGISVLVGIANDDCDDDMLYVIQKLLTLRLWSDSETEKMWQKNVVDIQGGILLISQFTLMHQLKGTKPDFHHAMPPIQAKNIFEKLCTTMRGKYISEKIQSGNFQHYMKITQTMDGPVTIILDSKNRR